MAGFHDAVYLQLPLRKLPVDGERACVVRAVVLCILRSRVAQGQSSAFEQAVRRVAVHDFAVLCEDGCEALVLAQRVGHAVHLSTDVFLGNPWTRHPHSVCVHLVADGAGFFYLCDLNVCLALAHLDDGHDEFHRCRFFLLAGMDAQQVHNLYLRVVTVGRKKVNLPMLTKGFVADNLQLLHRSAVFHAHLAGQILHIVH